MTNGTSTVESTPFAHRVDEEPESYMEEEWFALGDDPALEEDWEEDAFEEEDLGTLYMEEAARRSPARRTRVQPVRRAAAMRTTGGPATVQIPTQRGPIQATLNQRFVTPEQLSEAIRRLEATTAKNLVETKRELQSVEKNAITRADEVRRDVTRSMTTHSRMFKKHVKDTRKAYGMLKKEIADTRQTSMLMALMNKPDDIQRITLASPPSASSTTLDVTNTQYKDSNNLLPILLMSGMMGGTTSGDNSNTLILALALSGGL